MTEVSAPYVRYQPDGRIGYIVLDRPEKLNALADESIIAFLEACRAFDEDPDAWVAIVYGTGRAFSSGADVRQRQNRSPEEIRRLGGVQGRGADIREAFRSATQRQCKPMVAAVHGLVLGAALRLVLHCDLVVAAEETRFQVTEIARGLDATSFWSLLADRVGSGFADSVCMTGRFFTAEEAASRGLVDQVAPAGGHLESALAVAHQILENPPLAVRAVVRSRRARIEEIELSARQQTDRSLTLSADFRESVQAFLEKRPPVYRGI